MVRAPILYGALIDIMAHLKKDVSMKRVNAALEKAANGAFKGVLDYNDDGIVSADIIVNDMNTGTQTVFSAKRPEITPL